jgi:hypothetical protein
MELRKEIDTAYAAGAMEGDGSFFICRRGGKYIKFVAGAGIGKSSKELAGFFVSTFSGTVNIRGDQHRWSISSSLRMIPFLEAIIPYLQMKKERAQYLLEWLKEGMQDKENSYSRMKELNEEVIKKIVSPGDIYSVDEDPIKWAYIAGLMDTDGSFMISKRMAHNGMKNPNYLAKISYGEKDIRPPSFVRKTFPFGVISLKDNDKCVNGRFVWELVVKEDMIAFIKRILPYMKVKKQNAEILLKFCENYKPVRKGHRFGIPQEELEFREKCYQDLHKFQRRGKYCDLYKSSLMDLNTLPDNAEGNKAQVKENELKFKYIDPEEPIHDYPGLGRRKYISKEELLIHFPDQRERSKREDARNGDAVL